MFVRRPCAGARRDSEGAGAVVHDEQAGVCVVPPPVSAGDRVSRRPASIGVPFDEAIASADAVKAFTFADIDRAMQYTYVIEPAMDDAYRMVAANAAGVKPNLGAAIYARLLISRQNADGDWDGFHQRPPSSYSRVTMATLGLRAVQLYHHPTPEGAGRCGRRARAEVPRVERRARYRGAQLSAARTALGGRRPRDAEEAGRGAAGDATSGRRLGARSPDARVTCTRPGRRWSRCTMAASVAIIDAVVRSAASPTC